MHIPFANNHRRAAWTLLIAGFTLHLYAQYPGPAESENDFPLSASTVSNPPQGPHDGLTPSENSVQSHPDFDKRFPASIDEDTPARGSISVVELQHPLSRKGQTLLAKAQSDLHAGKLSEGFAEIDKALKDSSAVPYAHSLLGAIYLQMGRVPEAISELEQAVQFLPIAANYSNLGYAHALDGDTDQGEKELHHALELDPSSPQAHYLIGLILLDTKSRNHEACEQLQSAERAVRSAQMALAVCYVRAGQDDAADRQVKAFVGAGDDAHIAFWKRWVSWVAAEARPSLVFGFHAQ